MLIPKQRKFLLLALLCLAPVIILIAIWENGEPSTSSVFDVSDPVASDLDVHSEIATPKEIAKHSPNEESSRQALTQVGAPREELPTFAAQPITISVTDQSKWPGMAPLPGVEVLVRSLSKAYRGMTNDSGEVVVTIPGTEEYLAIELFKAGYFHGRFQKRWAKRIRTSIRQSTQFFGRVLDATTKEPVVATIAHHHSYCDRLCSPDSYKSSEDGRFVIPGVPAGSKLNLNIEAPGYPKLYQSVSVEEQTEIEILLTQGVEIRCQVFDVQTNETLSVAQLMTNGGNSLTQNESGVFVGLVRPEDNATETNLLLALGYLESQKPPPQKASFVTLKASAPNYPEVKLRIDFGTLEPEGIYHIPLIRGTKVTGVVQSKDKEIVEGAIVGFSIRTNPKSKQSNRALTTLQRAAQSPVSILEFASRESRTNQETDRTGLFEVDSLIPWMNNYFPWVYVQKHNSSLANAVITSEPGSTQVMDLNILAPESRSAFVEGTLTFRGVGSTGIIEWSNEFGRGSRPTDQGGNYWFFTQPGPIKLTPKPEATLSNEIIGLGYGYVVPIETMSANLEPNSSQRFDFNLNQDITTFTGTVRSKSGEPFANDDFDVYVPPNALDFTFADTDHLGRFSFDVANTVDALLFEIFSGGKYFEFGGIQTSHGHADIVLPDVVRVMVRVRAADTKSEINDYRMWTKGADILRHQRDGLSMRNENDGWKSTSVTSTDSRLLIKAKGYRDTELSSLALTEGKHFEVELEPEIVVRFKLDSTSAALPKGVSAYFMQSAVAEMPCPSDPDYTPDLVGTSFAFSQLQFDKNGESVVRGLGVGVYELRSCPPGITFVPPKLELTGESVCELELQYIDER